MENFDRPYQARSVAEFWRRWHISLSTWFRDYVYVPLGGNRVGSGRRQLNLLVTFLASGLWHGANWTYVVWGMLHGFYMVAGLTLKPWRQRIASRIGLDRSPGVSACLSVVCTFLLVCSTWVFFRADSLSTAFLLIANSVRFAGEGLDVYILTKHQINLALLGLAVLFAVELMQGSKAVHDFLMGRSLVLRWSAYYTLTLSILYLGTHEVQEFIYFQF
jgi:D-alanyl-lipoteichoic acid acyltransferase DltB (MBOAT superfamily)